MKFWLLILIVFQTTLATAQNPVIAESLAIPILKGTMYNPVLKLIIPVSGGQTVHLGLIKGQLTSELVNQIDNLDVFLTEAEPFNTKLKVSSFKPVSADFTIPMDIKLGPGQHFIWLSPQLKTSAPVGESLKVSLTALEKDGKVIKILTKGQLEHLTGSVVKKAGEDQVHTYRIPGLVTTGKGTLLAVYDIRYLTSRDLPGHIDVGLSRSTDGGNTWEPMRTIMDMGPPHENNGIGDPAILYDPATNTVWVAALWSKGNRSIAGSLPGLSPDTTGQFVLVKSTDDGLTWSAPYSITTQVKNPAWHLFFNGPGRGIVMHDGTLVFAAQYWDEHKMPHSTIIYSRDHGRSWQGKIHGPKANTTESQVIETTPGRLMLNMRDNRGGYRSVACTDDLGGQWVEHSSSYQALKDPVCMGSLFKSRVRINQQWSELVFFSNPHTSSGRYNMTIQASEDLGETWLPSPFLLDERMTYGYSCLTGIGDAHLGILYEGQGDLYFVKIPITTLLAK